MDDPSEHLGINLVSGFYTCWRDATHKGSPEQLLIQLLGLSKGGARLLIEAYSFSYLDDFGAPPTITGRPEATARPARLPTDFKSIEAESLTHKFWQYIYDRGFDDPDQVISDYDLKSCLIGRWKGRLIIPVRDSKGLVGWQGRSLRNVEDVPRYLTSSELVKATIFNLQNLKGGKDLYICEGPLDALKIDFYGKVFGIRATCLFGVNFTHDQISKLIALRPRFNRAIALFDNDSAGVTAGFAISDYIPDLIFGQLPDATHDPGSMSKQDVLKLCGI